MSEDKQQTWAEAVVECVTDEKERARLLNFYEPDEMAAALLRQVAIANDLRAALATRDEKIAALTHDRDSWREQADERASDAVRWLERVRELESGLREAIDEADELYGRWRGGEKSPNLDAARALLATKEPTCP